MFVGAPRWPSCMPTEIPITVAAPMSRVARVGTGATNTPAGDIPQAERAAGLNYARKRGPTGVRSSKDAAHARPRDVRDGDMVLFENLQNAEMRETSCKPSP